jgi:hypothetical protein
MLLIIVEQTVVPFGEGDLIGRVHSDGNANDLVFRASKAEPIQEWDSFLWMVPKWTTHGFMPGLWVSPKPGLRNLVRTQGFLELLFSDLNSTVCVA